MCGRYTIDLSGDGIQKRFLTEEAPDFDGTYNAAPQQRLPIIRRDDATNHVDLATWGLQPAWADNNHDGFINARVETADEKQSFADAWHQHRCLIPTTGFYEWTGTSGGKTPHYIPCRDADVYSFAGLYRENGEEVTYTILTMPANDDVSDVHNRMPVILHKDEEGSWVLGDLTKDRLHSDRPRITHHAVSKAVNTPENDAAFLTEKKDDLTSYT